MSDYDEGLEIAAESAQMAVYDLLDIVEGQVQLIEQLQATNKELLDALEEMTADFKAEMDSEYTDGVMMYPSYQRNYKRDKEQLDRAQAAITNAKQVKE